MAQSQEDPNSPMGPSGGSPENPFDWRYFVWLGVLLLVIVYWAGTTSGPQMVSVPYSEFKGQVQEGNVEEVVIRGENLRGTYKETAGVKTPDSRYFTTVLPSSVQDPELMQLLEKNDVTVRAEPTGGPWWAEALISILPWILIIGLIVWATKRMQERMGGMGQSGLFGFGKSKAKRFREGETKVTFADVAGLENAKKDLQEVINYLKDPERYRAIGAKVPRGMLLMGPPGTGKTMLARAAAGEAGVPFYSISASEFIEMFVGVGAARVRDMFESAKKEEPAVIFIDELDSVGRSRGTGLGGGHDEREQTLNQILAEMDGFEPHEAVVVLAATNRPDVLDPALLRPGRFDRKVEMDMPRKEAREAILKVHTRKVPLAEDVDLETVAKRTVGFSGADIENLVNEAALLAARDDKKEVDMAAFDKARDKILLGAEREGLLSEEEKEIVAYHESGHALMAWLLPEADPLEKVTIIPRGRALGATEQMPEEDRHNLRRKYLFDRIGVMLGGRCAERTFFDDITSGAENDLKQATQLAQRMVAQWGMSDTFGSVAYRKGEEAVFLGREMAQEKDYSEKTAELIDDEVKRLISGQEERVMKLMDENRDKVERLAQTLLEKENVEREEVIEIFGGEQQKEAGGGQTEPGEGRTAASGA